MSRGVASLILALALVPSLARAQEAQEAGPELGDPGARLVVIEVAPEAAPEEPPFLPAALSERPLTLPGGTGRIEQAFAFRIGRSFAPMVPVGFALGVVDDLELGFSWPLPWDPTFYALGRLVRDPVIEFGAALAITAPVSTDGNTLGRVSIPVLVRPIHWLRLDTGLEVELLFTPSNVSPLASIPLTITINPHPGFFLGAQGSAGWLDGDAWVADAGGFFGFTVYTAQGAIADFRATAQAYFPGGNFAFSLAATFYPRFWS